MGDIQRDRPELAARIHNLSSMSVEELLQVT